jgi:hypothetical protein
MCAYVWMWVWIHTHILFPCINTHTHTYMHTLHSLQARNRVTFPASGLDVSPFSGHTHTHTDSENGDTHTHTPLYELYAVVIHHGRAMSVGHFTCYAYSQVKGVCVCVVGSVASCCRCCRAVWVVVCSG